MVAELQEYQFEVGGVVFGLDAPVMVLTSGFKPSGSSWRTQDFEHPQGDGGVPGRDYQAVGTFGFEMFADGTDEASALAQAAQLRNVWPAEGLVRTPRALTPLRYRLGGRTRRVYGRPRRWTPGPTTDLVNGYLDITADFAIFDPLFYDDAEESISFNMAEQTTGGGGFRTPFRMPMRTVGVATPTGRAAFVGGDRETWPIIELTGGINPWVEINGWRAKVVRSLNWDETVTIDTRPWVRSSTINGGFARLDRGSRISKMRLSPKGRNMVMFGNDSPLSPANVTVRWHNANSSL